MIGGCTSNVHYRSKKHCFLVNIRKALQSMEVTEAGVPSAGVYPVLVLG
jgi:hypothetical protein